MQNIVDYAVIGCGLMGSAAAKYLAESGASVAAIGPAEPAVLESHDGVFASHYDQGRLTYQLSYDAIWTYLGRESIARYAEIEARAGIRFHGPVGRITAMPPAMVEAEMSYPIETAEREGIPYHHHPVGETQWQDQFPFLNFPDAFAILHEPSPAGYINPRQLVAAQLAIAQQEGATLHRQEVHGVNEDTNGIEISLANGEVIQAKKVLVAAGAFTNFNALLPQPIPLKIKTETIILGKISAAEASRLSTMPVVVYQIDDPEINDIYMAPPLQYPDGHTYLKMGANTEADLWPETLQEIADWFHHGDSDSCKTALVQSLRSMLPGVNFESMVTKRCIVCYTPSRVPIIDEVGTSGRFFVAAGGNGSGAKGSDMLGRLAAGLMMSKAWPDGLARKPFVLKGGHTEGRL